MWHWFSVNVSFTLPGNFCMRMTAVSVQQPGIIHQTKPNQTFVIWVLLLMPGMGNCSTGRADNTQNNTKQENLLIQEYCERGIKNQRDVKIQWYKNAVIFNRPDKAVDRRPFPCPVFFWGGEGKVGVKILIFFIILIRLELLGETITPFQDPPFFLALWLLRSILQGRRKLGGQPVQHCAPGEVLGSGSWRWPAPRGTGNRLVERKIPVEKKIGAANSFHWLHPWLSTCAVLKVYPNWF